METPESAAAAPEPTADEQINAELNKLLGKAPPQQAPRAEETPATASESSVLDDDEVETPEPQETGLTIKALAKAQGVDVKDIKFTLDNGDGTAREIPYAQVKQALEASDSLAAERLEFEQAMQAQTKETLADRQQLYALASLLGDKIPKDFGEQYQSWVQKNVQRENALTLATIPSWKDETTRTTERAMMTDYLKSFKFTEAEADTIVDHRMVNFVRYHARLVKRIAELEKSQPKGAGKPHKGAIRTDHGDVASLRRKRDAGVITGDQAAIAFLKTQGF